MKVFLIVHNSEVAIQARAEGDGGLLGDMFERVKEGEDFLGHGYAELRKLGDGEHDIKPKPAK